MSHTDKDFKFMSLIELATLRYDELQRIRNRRWANDLKELQEQADEELARRDPRTNWTCSCCGKNKFFEKEMRASGNALESFLNWEWQKYEAIVCDYCGNAEFHSVLMNSAEKTLRG
jgi:predicted nucleic-acid-binding Zn-ribbon protein